MITPDPQNGLGVPHRYARVRLLNAAPIGASRDSDVVDAQGYTRMWLFVKFANMATATNLVGALELLAGIGDLVADLVPMAVAAGNTMIGALPTGLTVDAQNDGYAIADTFESNGLIMLAFDRVPPRIAARFTSGSVAVPGTATITVDAYFQ